MLLNDLVWVTLGKFIEETLFTPNEDRDSLELAELRQSTLNSRHAPRFEVNIYLIAVKTRPCPPVKRRGARQTTVLILSLLTADSVWVRGHALHHLKSPESWVCSMTALNSCKRLKVWPQWCYARGPNPQNWENKTSTAMQRQKGNLLLARARTQVSSNAMEWNKGPEPWITAVFIRLRQRQGVDRGGLVARVP